MNLIGSWPTSGVTDLGSGVQPWANQLCLGEVPWGINMATLPASSAVAVGGQVLKKGDIGEYGTPEHVGYLLSSCVCSGESKESGI